MNGPSATQVTSHAFAAIQNHPLPFSRLECHLSLIQGYHFVVGTSTDDNRFPLRGGADSRLNCHFGALLRPCPRVVSTGLIYVELTSGMGLIRAIRTTRWHQDFPFLEPFSTLDNSKLNSSNHQKGQHHR